MPRQTRKTASPLFTQLLRSVNVNAPDIISMDLEQGFLLLDDLGNRQYLDYLDEISSDDLYNDALLTLINMLSAYKTICRPMTHSDCWMRWDCSSPGT